MLELIPSFALYRGLYEFSQYAFLHGYGVRSTSTCYAASIAWCWLGSLPLSIDGALMPEDARAYVLAH